MRLESVRIRNLGPFRDFAVDLTGLGDARLVAVVGENGAGKSTLLELALPGAMYRSTPTRGTLTALATARDAMLEARIVSGKRYTIRHLVDCISGKSEAVVLGEDGAPLLDSSKVRDFDHWAARNLPPPEVLFSTVFQPQGAGGFLGMKPAERKGVLLRVLGVERLEAMAERAREHQRETRAKLEVPSARLADERARGGDVAALEVELADAQRRAEESQAALELAQRELAAASAEAERVRELRRQRDQRLEQLGAAKGQAEALQREISDLEGRVANNRSVLEDAERIRTAVARAEELRREIEQTRAAEAEERAAERRARDRARAAGDAYAAAKQAANAAEARARKAEQRLAEREAIERAAAELPGAERKVTELNAASRAAEDELDRVRGERLAGAEERIRGLRGGLQRVAASEHIGEARGEAQEALRLDDGAVQAAASQPERVRAAQQAAHRAFQALEQAQRRVAELRTHASGAKALADAKDDLASARREIVESDAAAVRHAEEQSDALQEVKKRQRAADEHNRALADLVEELQRLEPLARKAEPLSRAEARLAELEPALEGKREELQVLRQRCEELAADADEAPLPPVPDLGSIEQRIRQHEADRLAATSAVAVARKQHEAALVSSQRLEALEADLRTAEAELADWNRLADDLGKNGLQALEIDAAGPELTELVNDLLHTCHGPRFTLRVDTQRASADGKRLIEGCEVIVLDTERGREAEGSTFSGGERVLIGEALSLALSMLACRRAGVERPTLVRDESGAALDPANARVYVAMLRRAADLVGADRVLFVSHSPDVIDMADARIEVRGAVAGEHGAMPQAAE
jgi:DNA repair protein SbcC/Rad50